MDIPKFIATLTKEEVNELKEYFLQENKLRKKEAEQEQQKIREQEIEKEKQQVWEKMAGRTSGLVPVNEFVETFRMSVRLKNSLLYQWGNRQSYYMDDILKRQFLLVRNSGKKSWKELLDIVDNSMKGSRFEAQQEVLLKHFEDQDRIL